jgi:integrase
MILNIQSQSNGRSEEPVYSEIDPGTPFIAALKLVKDKVECSDSTKRDLRTMIPYVEKAAKNFRFENIPINQVRRKHIRLILDKIEETSRWKSSHRYNKHRSNFMMLFSELTELEAIEFNPVRDLRKKKVTFRIREVLEPGERKKINEHLKIVAPALHIFAHIFFHSGARFTEMISLKGSSVDLKKQRFKILVRKGREFREVWRTIKDVAIPYWEIAMKDCKPGDHVFGKGLVPGPVAMQRDWLTAQWEKHVKKSLGIKKDFYSLKHLNTDETAAMAGIVDAAAQDGHTTPVITLKHYAVGEKQRQHERLKKINNPF